MKKNNIKFVYTKTYPTLGKNRNISFLFDSLFSFVLSESIRELLPFLLSFRNLHWPFSGPFEIVSRFMEWRHRPPPPHLIMGPGPFAECWTRSRLIDECIMPRRSRVLLGNKLRPFRRINTRKKIPPFR